MHAWMLAVPGAMRLCVLRQVLWRCAWLYWDRVVLAARDICVLATAPTRAHATSQCLGMGAAGNDAEQRRQIGPITHYFACS